MESFRLFLFLLTRSMPSIDFHQACPAQMRELLFSALFNQVPCSYTISNEPFPQISLTQAYTKKIMKCVLKNILPVWTNESIDYLVSTAGRRAVIRQPIINSTACSLQLQAVCDCEETWQHWLSISFSQLVTSHFPHVNLSLSLPGLPFFSHAEAHTPSLSSTFPFFPSSSPPPLLAVSLNVSFYLQGVELFNASLLPSNRLRWK